MKQIIFAPLYLFFLLHTQAQDRIFDAAKIPEELKKNCNSVIRDEKIEFRVTEMGKAIYSVHKVITVLNENAKDELQFQSYSDQFHILESVSIQLFDAQGFPLQKYKRSDLSSQVTGSGLVPDGKVHYLELPVRSYPITVQFDYETRYKGILRYPAYHFQVPDQSVENSTFTAIVPADLDLRYKAKNTALKPETVTEGTAKHYTWTLKNLPALPVEAGSLSANSGYPHILLAPNKFQFGGYPGEMNTWKNLGKWFGLIGKNTNNLSEASKQYIRSLVKDAPNDREKTRIIYKYLQANFRYVSIQLGMGGLIPFEADFVDKKKYGDCKALSNYTYACLDAVGIKSHYALINSSYNEEPVDPSFPYDGFNHVILCVPQPNDSIWLECTSNTNEFAVLGSFTENRNALLVTPDGGHLVPTPKSKSSDNIFSSNTIIHLQEDGSGVAEVTLNASGYYRDLLSHLATQKKDDQKHFIVNYFDYMNPDDFAINHNSLDNGASLRMKLEMGKIPEFTAGKKSFLNPRIYKLWNNDLPKGELRTQDYYFHNPFIKTDTSLYKLPDGFGIETLPKTKKVNFEFGSFTSSYEYDESNKTVRSVARLELSEYKIPAAKYVAARNFFNEVLGEYTEKIVIRRL